MSTDLSAAIPSDVAQPSPHPPSDAKLASLVLCIVVAIERFSFHILFALFVLFLTEEHKLSEQQATLHFGLLLSVMYFTPFVGGAVADRFGRWRTIVFGAALIAVGYLALALGLSVACCVATLAA